MIARIKVELMGGAVIPEVVRAMVDIAEKYGCEVSAELQGTLVTVGADRVRDILELWDLRRERESQRNGNGADRESRAKP